MYQTLCVESFNKLKKYCDRSDYDNPKIDWQLSDGKWVSGWVNDINTNTMGVHVGAMINGIIKRETIEYSNAAPACSWFDWILVDANAPAPI